MKKVVVMILILFLNINVYAKEVVKLDKCVDGDTAWFYYNNETSKFRFLAIDTPESVSTTKSVEPYGKEASDYTCEKLTKANEIVLEYEDSNKTDKYGRSLAWIWVDGNLLQKELIENGLGKVAYIYGKYRYTDSLCLIQKKALENKLNVWSQNGYEEGYCSTISYDNVTDNIKYDDIENTIINEEKLNKNLEKFEKIDNKITSVLEENNGKFERILLYVFLGIGILSTIIKEAKKK